jgi:mannose-6-phosphate isomerase-like protein (cupin superfamily)
LLHSARGLLLHSARGLLLHSARGLLLRVDFLGLARQNDAFRRVVLTGRFGQVVAMAIPVGGEIGEEVHEHVDQLLVFVEGAAEAVLDGERFPVAPGELVFVHAGTRHNFVNTGDVPLRLMTVYAPPEHAPDTVHRTKAEADRAEAEGTDQPPLT